MSDYNGEMQAQIDDANSRGKPLSSGHLKKAILSVVRRAKMVNTAKSLPFPLVEWPSIRSKQCPGDNRAKPGSSERALSFAHIQILLDFVHCDHDTFEVFRAAGTAAMKPGTLYANEPENAISGKFVAVGPAAGADADVAPASGPGRGHVTEFMTKEEEEWYRSQGPGLYKNGIPFRDDDILVVLEDDVDASVENVSSSLIAEFNDMTNVDFVYLGWCPGGKGSYGLPLCSHAYAVTRAGARSIIKHFEPCGAAYDWQLVKMLRNRWLRYRKARDANFKELQLKKFQKIFSRGIFVQDDTMGSFNGNEREKLDEKTQKVSYWRMYNLTDPTGPIRWLGE